MFRAWLTVAVLFHGLILRAGDGGLGASPSYTVFSIVNSADFTASPLAPNSIVSIFGTGLARSTAVLTAADIKAGKLPVELNSVLVSVDGSPAPLFYTSDGQINFLMPPEQIPGNVHVRVLREGVTGPDIVVTLVDASPALFQTVVGYAIAQHGVDYTVITPDSPARAGETIVLYATGLGKTSRNPVAGEIPQYASPILRLAELKVTLNGATVDAGRVQYAGLTPGSAGLYQINLVLPSLLAADPEIRVSIGTQASAAGIKLAMTAVGASSIAR